ncbi:hypothetical protein GCM10009734_33420 [Nonomuraea bangladeshensis]
MGGRGRERRLQAMFACMYYAALRPGETLALRQQDCQPPATRWGRILVDVSRPEVNVQWTDTGDAHEERGLKAPGPRRCPPGAHPAQAGSDSSATHRGVRRR